MGLNSASHETSTAQLHRETGGWHSATGLPHAFTPHSLPRPWRHSGNSPGLSQFSSAFHLSDSSAPFYNTRAAKPRPQRKDEQPRCPSTPPGPGQSQLHPDTPSTVGEAPWGCGWLGNQLFLPVARPGNMLCVSFLQLKASEGRGATRMLCLSPRAPPRPPTAARLAKERSRPTPAAPRGHRARPW